MGGADMQMNFNNKKKSLLKQNTDDLDKSSQKTEAKKKPNEPLRASHNYTMPSCLANYFSKNEFFEAIESS